MKNKKNLTGIGIVLIIITILAVGGVVYAGTITPPSGTPAAQFYTLSEIYNFITSNTTATEGGHGFTFSDSLEGTGRTLTEIYSSLASLISADKVKSGTTYLNVAGSLVPNGGTATAAGLFNGLTAHLTGDWDLDTGTLDLACNTATFDGAGNLVATSYDGSGDGTNRFCMTASGDAVAGDLLTGLVAWVDGIALTGTMPDKEGDSASTAQSAAGGVNYFTAPTGFYDGDDRVSATDAEVATLAPRRMAEQTTTITPEQPRPAGTLAHGPLAMRAIAIAAQATVVPMPKMIQPDSSGAYHVTVQAALLFPIHLS